MLKVYASLLRFLGFAALVIGTLTALNNAYAFRGFDFGRFIVEFFVVALVSLQILVVAELIIKLLEVSDDIGYMRYEVNNIRKRLDELNERAKNQQR
ncbi:MAG: hypothetical protein RML95_06960 [Anaerolineae bacterium]|nr:hypothetical protein [Anaerolineae bacterium]MDW8299061.1 hypothetical protein [Anaerolineae bacterium]